MKRGQITTSLVQQKRAKVVEYENYKKEREGVSGSILWERKEKD